MGLNDFCVLTGLSGLMNLTLNSGIGRGGSEFRLQQVEADNEFLIFFTNQVLGLDRIGPYPTHQHLGPYLFYAQWARKVNYQKLTGYLLVGK